jgi:phenylalanine-4-hydroxylase
VSFEIPSNSGLRGDYSRIRPDYTVDQDWSAYADEEHEIWRLLYRRQSEILPRYACREVIDAVRLMDMSAGIPDLARVNRQLDAATGWQLVAVPGLIPNDVFFDHLAHRRFPVTIWIRRRDELDYIVEPDVFHDFFGHVPLLFNPVFADYMQAYGEKGVEALAHDSVPILARLYWYMVEFGLIRTADGLRAFGAGILSSHAELPYAIESPVPNRIGFDPRRIMRTDYMIDDFQKTYFVLDSFAELFEATRRDFVPIYQQLRGQPALPAEAVLDTDVVHTRGTIGRPMAA